MSAVKIHDVLNKTRLKHFQAKQSEWNEWLDGNDVHSIWKQVCALQWDYALFLTVNDLRKRAVEQQSEGVGFNWPVIALFDAGFVATQAMGIRRLVDKGKDVISLRRLVDDLQSKRELISREVYVSHSGLTYDPSLAKEMFHRTMAQSGARFVFEWAETTGPNAWHSTERAHEFFDRLSGKTPESRTRDDFILPEWFEKLDLRLQSCRNVARFSTKFITHAADPRSRSELSLHETGVTLERLAECHKTILAVASFVGTVLIQKSAALGVPMPQLDVVKDFDLPWVKTADMETARACWNQNLSALENWLPKSLWEFE